MEQFIFGPLQTLWIKSLKENPNRQLSGKLGLMDPTTHAYKACCLGEAALICGIGKWDNLRLRVEYLHTETHSHGTTTVPANSTSFLAGDNHKVIGLFGPQGEPNPDLIPVDTEMDSLSEMNDSDTPWLKIAEHIEKYPHIYLTHSA